MGAVVSAEYAIREPGGRDLFVTESLAQALRYRRDGVRAGMLTLDSLVVDDDGSIYDLCDGDLPVVQKDGSFYAEWINGELRAEATP